MPHLPEKAAQTTAENPWPLRLLSMKIAEYVDRMSPLWVEGQITQLNERPGAPRAFLTLRDVDADVSITVTIMSNALRAMGPAVQQGARVVVQAKPVFWSRRGTLNLEARQIRAVGVGDLLARIEQLKQLLHSEGLFDPARKKPLPFLPATIGLITGRAGAAHDDVVENARRRWPGARFEVRQVAVQGQHAVSEVSAALQELDARPEVEVIVIARGGGSVEDLLPFSNETLVRAVSAARTPVVSAIGHDVDSPLLDLVADVRASTPTDAGKRVVPDLRAELDTVARLVDTGRRTLRRAIEEERRGVDEIVDARRALTQRIDVERRRVTDLASRPVLTDPMVMVTARRDHVAALQSRARTVVQHRLERAVDQIDHQTAQLRAYSPQQVLERGYAVVRTVDGRVLTSTSQIDVDDLLRVTLAEGDFAARPVSSDDVG